MEDTVGGSNGHGHPLEGTSEDVHACPEWEPPGGAPRPGAPQGAGQEPKPPMLDVRTLVIIAAVAGVTILCVYHPWIAVPIIVGALVFRLLNESLSL
jgi:hypothetical protein